MGQLLFFPKKFTQPRYSITSFRDGRFLVARNVATSVLEMLAELPEEKASLLLSFMHHTQV